MFVLASATIMASANMFGPSYIITRGAPADQDEDAISTPHRTSDQALRQFDMGHRVRDELHPRRVPEWWLSALRLRRRSGTGARMTHRHPKAAAHLLHLVLGGDRGAVQSPLVYMSSPRSRPARRPLTEPQ
ncbi:hypothetical protein [Streptosporangium longisporum]|uniref:hypothetical protein n=1 Tax=Streptosporangium longisporum TaxID=46187 RepID=UPI0031EF644B